MPVLSHFLESKTKPRKKSVEEVSDFKVGPTGSLRTVFSIQILDSSFSPAKATSRY